MNVMGKRFYDATSDAGGGGSDPAPVEPAAPPVTGDSSAPEPKPGAIDIQAEVDKRAAAIKREAEKEARKAMLQELGVEDQGKLKALVDADKQRLDEETTAAEKLETEKARHAADIQTWQKKYNALAIQNAFIMQAASGEKPIPADRQIAAFKLLDTSDVKVAEDGAVTGLDEAIEKLVEENPFLVAQPETQPQGGGKSPDIGATKPTGGRVADLPPNRQDILAGKKIKL